MIFCHKPYYNLNYTNPKKKIIMMIYALNPKKYTNYIMQNKKKLKKHRKKFKNQILKLLNYKDLLIGKNLNLQKQSNKFCKKPKEKICFLFLCDLSKLIFSALLEKDIE
jgi:hypothetical protein